MEKEKISQLKKTIKSRLNRPMRYYMDTCTRCGLCYDTCHAFNGIPKKEYSPVGRAEVVRKLYKKYTRLSGFLLPYWGDATRFDDTVMNQVYEAAWSCTGCRRCMVNCPFGIDTGQIMGVAKQLLEPELFRGGQFWVFRRRSGEGELHRAADHKRSGLPERERGGNR
jgi:Fe-S oxidoreductase